MTRNVAPKFEVGSTVVYPPHGIGVLYSIDDNGESTFNEACYVIRFTNGMTIMAPIKSADMVGLRHVIPKRDVSKVMSILGDGIDEDVERNWNKRQKAYQDKIKSGSIFEVASVYRDLFLLRGSKGLSFGEQQVFDNAHKLVVSELAVAKGVDEEKIIKMIDEALSN